MSTEPKCTGPFSDDRDCPIHNRASFIGTAPSRSSDGGTPLTDALTKGGEELVRVREIVDLCRTLENSCAWWKKEAQIRESALREIASLTERRELPLTAQINLIAKVWE